MNQDHTVDSLCYLLQDVVESFMSAMFSDAYKGNAHIHEALNIMTERYAQPLTLSMVAQEIGLSANYLSSLFQQVVGISFREQLCRIRVEESKRLLVSTKYPLVRHRGFHGLFGSELFLQSVQAHHRHYPEPIPAVDFRCHLLPSSPVGFWRISDGFFHYIISIVDAI